MANPKGYRFETVGNPLGHIIESEARKESDLKQLSKKILKDAEKANSLLISLSQKKYENRMEIKAVFNCEQKKLIATFTS